MKNSAALLIFICLTVSIAIASDSKTEIITQTTLRINVPDHHFVRIHNFTQEGGSTRGVVIASAATPTATPTPTPTPTATPTPTCTPTPCPPTPTPTPTPTITPTPTPTPTPPPQTVLTATVIDPTAPPEFIKTVTIAGPVTLTIAPVSGAKLFITYRKFSEPTPSPTP
jgi:hypothetical protein